MKSSTKAKSIYKQHQEKPQDVYFRITSHLKFLQRCKKEEPLLEKFLATWPWILGPKAKYHARPAERTNDLNNINT